MIKKPFVIFFSRIYFSLLYLSFLFWGALNFSVFGLNLGPWDPLFIILLFMSLFCFKCFYLLKYSAPVYLLVILFCVYAILPAVNGVHFSSASLSLYLQLLRCVLVFFLTIVVFELVDTDLMFRDIINCGFLYSIIMLVLFYMVVMGYKLPVFERGEFGSIRFEGFAFDANFLGIFLTLPLFMAVNKGRYIVAFTITTVIMLTLSRSVFFLVLLSFIFMFMVKKNSLLGRTVMLSFGVVGLLIIFLVSNINIPALGYSLYEILVLRLAQSSPRFDMWMELMAVYPQKPLFGFGLRSSQVLLGNYAHNSFLETLFEYGAVGLFLLLLIIISTIILSVHIVRKKESHSPIAQAYLLSAGAFGGFTILYHPYFWFLFGMVVGSFNLICRDSGKSISYISFVRTR